MRVSRPALFDAQPTADAVAAAQPLHFDDGTGGGDSTGADRTDEATAEDSALTVSQAARRAEVIAEMRAGFEATVAVERVRPRRAARDIAEEDDLDTPYDRSDDEDLSQTGPDRPGPWAVDQLTAPTRREGVPLTTPPVGVGRRRS